MKFLLVALVFVLCSCFCIGQGLLIYPGGWICPTIPANLTPNPIGLYTPVFASPDINVHIVRNANPLPPYLPPRFELSITWHPNPWPSPQMYEAIDAYLFVSEGEPYYPALSTPMGWVYLGPDAVCPVAWHLLPQDWTISYSGYAAKAEVWVELNPVPPMIESSWTAQVMFVGYANGVPWEAMVSNMIMFNLRNG